MFHKIVNCFTLWINMQKYKIIYKNVSVYVVVLQRVTKV